MLKRNMVCAALAFALAGTVAAAAPAVRDAPAVQDTREAAVARLLADYDKPGRPGLAVGVYHRGKVVLVRTAGYANLEDGVKVTPDTRFDLASVSKHFTGFAIAQLARQGRIDLDADIRTYLPWVPSFGGARITTRQLLHHTSGLREMHELASLAGFDVEHIADHRQFLNIVERQTALNFAPGTRYAYSNTGYTLLGEIVKAVTGRTLRQYSTEAMFRPLGMTSFFRDSMDEVIPHQGIGYMKQGDGWIRGTIVTNSPGESAVQATIGDMMTWVGNLARPTLGDAALFAEYTRPATVGDGQPMLYGFGIGLEKVAGRRALSHAGGMMGNVTNLAYLPDDDLGVVVLMLDGSWDAPRLTEKILHVYLGDRPAVRPAVAPSPAVARTLAGDYLGTEAGWPVAMGRKRIVRRGDAFYLDTAAEAVTGKAAQTRLLFRPDGTFDEGEGQETAYRPVLENGRVVGIDAIDIEQPQGRFRYARTTAFRPDPAAMPAYEGRYCSDELDICYTLRRDGSDLTATSIATSEPIRLAPVLADRFDGRNWYFGSVGFVRDAGGAIVGMNVGSARARNSYFARRPASLGAAS